MSESIMVHVTVDLPGRFRQIGLHVAEHPNGITVWCPCCTERQEYRRTWNGGWTGAAFLHDNGCKHLRERIASMK